MEVSQDPSYTLSTQATSRHHNATIASFTDDTTISATFEDPATASVKLEATTSKIDDWAKKWRINRNQSKSTHVTFTLCNQASLTVQMGMHIDGTLTCAQHIETKRKQLNLEAK